MIMMASPRGRPRQPRMAAERRFASSGSRDQSDYGMQIRRLTITRFRGIEQTVIHPGRRTVLLGPNNAAKSTILEALDLTLHPGLGRPRSAPDELDYYGRDPSQGFEVEVVLGALDMAFMAEVRDHLEGWDGEAREIVPEPDAEGAEPIVRVRVVGSADLDVAHEFAKPESTGARFGPRLRRQVGWLFDGRARDPAWQMTFHRGGVLDRLFDGEDLVRRSTMSGVRCATAPRTSAATPLCSRSSRRSAPTSRACICLIRALCRDLSSAASRSGSCYRRSGWPYRSCRRC